VLEVSAILFDLDGTLIDSKKDIALSVHHLQKKFGRPLSSEEDIARFIGDGMIKLVERAIGRESPDPVVTEAADFFKTHYREHALDHTRLYPGVAEALEFFRDKKMAIVTNKPTRILAHTLEALGVARYFQVVLGGDSVARMKPEPDGLLEALGQLGVRPSPEVLMVGDGAQDILAGRAAGVSTCGILSNIGDQTLLRQANPDYTIFSMHDLMRIIS